MSDSRLVTRETLAAALRERYGSGLWAGNGAWPDGMAEAEADAILATTGPTVCETCGSLADLAPFQCVKHPRLAALPAAAPAGEAVSSGSPVPRSVRDEAKWPVAIASQPDKPSPQPAGEPQTAAGRALLADARMGLVSSKYRWQDAILAIEAEMSEGEGTDWHYCDLDSKHHQRAEAAALDVERLARALAAKHDALHCQYDPPLWKSGNDGWEGTITSLACSPALHMKDAAAIAAAYAGAQGEPE